MIHQKLIEIQNRVKVPKNRYNSFGKYNYRSLEDILDTVKPMLLQNGLSLHLSDEVVSIGGANYIKAHAVLRENETGELIECSAVARESVDKKGMDDSQITGTASSYARKYCLNGLFLIDDTKDADTNEYQNENRARKEQRENNNRKQIANESQTKPSTEPVEDSSEEVSPQEKVNFSNACKQLGVNPTDLLCKCGWVRGTSVTKAQFTKALLGLQEISNAKKRDGN